MLRGTKTACYTTMTKPLYVYVTVVCLLAACSSSAQQAASPSKPPATAAPAPTSPPAQAQSMPKGTNANSDAGLINDFKARVDEYVKLRDKAENAAPVELEKKSKPAE